MKINYRISFLCLFVAAALLWLALAQRLGATYLEDDLLWFIPSVENTLHTQSLIGIIKNFHTSEMTFFDGVYFSCLLTVAGHHFPVFAYASFLCHFLNAIAFFLMLVLGLRLSQGVSLLASLIYLTFYGQYHAYFWPMAAHHLWVLFFTFTIMTLYLIADRRLNENQGIGKIYGWMAVLAIVAGFNRLSILVLPLMMASHLGITTNDTAKLISKVRRWLPILYLLTVYQLIDVFLGGKQDVLSRILPQQSHQWAWSIGVVVAAGWAGLMAVIFILLRHLLKNLVKNRLYTMRYPWYLLLFFSYPLSLCCYTWLAPMASVGGGGVYTRWQPMMLPAETLAHTGWWLLGSVILFCVIRVALAKKELFIFLVWYIFLIPYLALYGERIPSRYLLYVSPILSVSIALIWAQLKGKEIRIIVATGMIILMASNILAIHVRSLSSWTTDYRWSYDFIKYAKVIKTDLIQQGIKPSDASICVQHVGPMPYLDNWRGKFLPDDFDGYRPFVDITESILGARPHAFKINEPCAANDQRYDALQMDEARINILSGPIKGNRLELYAQDYESDAKIIHNDRLIYQGSVFSKPLSMNQGHFVGKYKGFSIFYFGEHFFIIKSRHFNLVQFKLNNYKPGDAAKTLWESRQWIDQQEGITPVEPSAPLVPEDFSLVKSYVFKMNAWGIPLGEWQWQIGQGYLDHRQYTSSVFILKPYGYVYKTILDQNFLPVQSEEGNLAKFNKHLLPVVTYDHMRGVMERRGYKEDILDDTRDLAGLLTWILSQEYRQGNSVQTSFHIGRNLYLCEAVPRNVMGDHVLITIRIARILRDLTIRPCGSLEALFITQRDVNLPLQLKLKFGFFHLSINVKTVQ